MSPALLVREPGLRTTIQDFGRPGFQRFGVPVSGALDPMALEAANLVAGNPPGAAALEVAVTGPLVEVAAESVRIAVAGPDLRIEVAGRAPVPALVSTTLARGERARIVASRDCAVGYVAIAGGIDVAPVLGSRSTALRARLGGFEGRMLAAGDRLPLVLERAPGGPERRAPSGAAGRLDLRRPDVLRVMLAEAGGDFSAEALAGLVASAYRVAAAADRMGLRLDGPAVTALRRAEGLSVGIAPGAIQIPGDGAPILLLADRQTTGGYPAAAHVVAADLAAAGRLRPGDPIRFVAVGTGEAATLRAARRTALTGFAAGIAAVPAKGIAAAVDVDLLAATNLVSGVTRGDDQG